MGEVAVTHREAIPGCHLNSKKLDEKVCNPYCKRNLKVDAFVQVGAGFFDRLIHSQWLIAQNQLSRLPFDRGMVYQVAHYLGNILTMNEVEAGIDMKEAQQPEEPFYLGNA